jgi:arabinogalactan endo-1,4-beta-galactosidase
MKTVKYVALALCMFGMLACKKSSSNNNNNNNGNPTDTTAPVVFAKGADISWVTQMESSGSKFYDSAGVQTDCFQLMKSLGVNSIRLRVWVNPTGGWNDSVDVLNKAVRAKNLGMRVMLDFHYSDSWADPGKQNKPAAWTSLSTTGLINEVYTHTYNVINYLKAGGVTPAWIQVGNEVSDGMLWNDGLASANMSNFAQMVSSGYAAAKAADTSIKVIVHLPNGYDNGLYRWMFDSLTYYAAKWDIVGMSLYPTTNNYAALDAQCLTNMNDMVSRYGKQVMICEVGMAADSASYCKAFLTDLISKVKSVNGNNGLGVFYWEPEAYNWQGYNLGAFDNTGKPTVALSAYAN